jgi:DNA-binding NarL/FixJ family response regulator
MSNQPTALDQPVRLLVVDDQGLMREGIISLLSLQDEIEVVGQAANGKEAIKKNQELRPDVILMDVRMPIMNGVEATAAIKRHYPECKILMLTTFDDDEYVIEALLAGANGYLLKNIPEKDLAQAIIAVHKGIYQLDPIVAQKVVAALAKDFNLTKDTPIAQEPLASGKAAANPNIGLTERELEILSLLAQGLSNSEIANKLLISEGTVKNHISSIFFKLKVRDRIQAVLYARENGLV